MACGLLSAHPHDFATYTRRTTTHTRHTSLSRQSVSNYTSQVLTVKPYSGGPFTVESAVVLGCCGATPSPASSRLQPDHMPDHHHPRCCARRDTCCREAPQPTTNPIQIPTFHPTFHPAAASTSGNGLDVKMHPAASETREAIVAVRYPTWLLMRRYRGLSQNKMPMVNAPRPNKQPIRTAPPKAPPRVPPTTSPPTEIAPVTPTNVSSSWRWRCCCCCCCGCCCCGRFAGLATGATSLVAREAIRIVEDLPAFSDVVGQRAPLSALSKWARGALAHEKRCPQAQRI